MGRPWIPGASHRVLPNRLLGLVNRHQRRELTGPLWLKASCRVARHVRTDDEVGNVVPKERSRHVLNQDLAGLLIKAGALFRIYGCIALVGERVQFFVAVRDTLSERGITGPVDAEPVLRVWVVLVPAAKIQGLRVSCVVLAKRDQRRAVDRLDIELDPENVPDLAREPFSFFDATGNLAIDR